MLYEFGNVCLARSLQVQPEWIHVELANVAMRPPHLIKGDERAPAEEKDVGKAYDAGLVKGDAVVARRKHYFEARVVRHCDAPPDYVALESSPPPLRCRICGCAQLRRHRKALVRASKSHVRGSVERDASEMDASEKGSGICGS